MEVGLEELRSLDRRQALAFYRTLLDGGDRDALRWMARHDRFFLLGCLMLREDVLERDWCYARCREVEASPDGHLDLWSRFHYKSTIITLGGTVQEVLKNPEITIGILSYNKQIAHKFVDQIRRALEMQELVRLFPDILYEKPPRLNWSTQNGLVVKRRSNPKEPTVSGSGLVDGQPIGAHYALRIYDDVVVPSSVTTPEQIRKTTEAWELSLALGTDDGGRAWYAGTRYHPVDTYAEILKRGSLVERRRLCVDGEGRATMMTDEALEKVRKDMGAFTFAAQMLQDPVSEGVRTFRDEWIQGCVYEKAPPRSSMNVYIMVDGANSKRKKSDRTVMWVIGLGEDGNYYVLDGVYRRLTLDERTNRLFRLHRKWRPLGVFYEQVGAMSDVAHIEYVMNHEQNYRFAITKVSRGQNDAKRQRITNLQAPFGKRRIWLPRFNVIMEPGDEPGTMHDVIADFIEQEYQTYPNPAHDDGLDCLADILDKQVADQMTWPETSESEEADEGGGDGLFAR